MSSEHRNWFENPDTTSLLFDLSTEHTPVDVLHSLYIILNQQRADRFITRTGVVNTHF